MSAGHRVVVLTPPGAGAIGVVRVVGPDAVGIVNQAFRPASGGALSPLRTDRLRYGHFVDGEETIDDVLVCVMARHGGAKPRSHEAGESAELVVDISAHGGVRVIERILQTLEGLGASLCDPADAVGLAWPTDSLIEHEAIEALTRAKTERAVRFLAWQRENLSAALESVAALCKSDPTEAHRCLRAMADGYAVARTLIEGATVALLGPPNCGKSTLFNRLTGRNAAVVSAQPGTTRDWVAQPLEMDGVPVTLVDTAGQREVDDPLEQEAMEAGRGVVQAADVRVLVMDGSEPLLEAGMDLPDASPSLDNCLRVMNKADARTAWPAAVASDEKWLSISALTGAGCDKLISAILGMLGYRGWTEPVPCLFTSRQMEAAAKVLSALPRDPVAAEQHLKGCLIGRCKDVTKADGGL